MRHAVARLLAAALLLSAPAAAAPRAYAPAERARIGARVFALVNEARVEAGLPALAWSDAVADVARAHAADMARRGYFGHRTPEGRTHGDRARAAGIAFRRFGENILKVDNPREAPERLARTIVEGFLGSPAHRGGIMTRGFKSSGVGVARSGGSGAILVTQCFLDPAAADGGSRGERTIRLPFGIRLRRR